LLNSMASSTRSKVNNISDPRTIRFLIWHQWGPKPWEQIQKIIVFLCREQSVPLPDASSRSCETQLGFLQTRQNCLVPAAPTVHTNHSGPWTYILQEPSFYPKLPGSHCPFPIFGIWLSRIESVRNENSKLPFLLRKAETG
jgi:hypothetical protein